METRVCLRCSVTCYLVYVTWAIFVAATTVDSVTIFEEDLTANLKILRQNVGTNDETRRTNFEFQTELPYWIAPIGNRFRFFEKSKQSTDQGTVLFPTDECSRYCIGRGSNVDEDNFQYINIFWSSNSTDSLDNPLPKGHLQLTMPEVKWTNEQNSNNVPRKCQIYLDLDCEIAETETDTNHIKKEFYANIQNNKENKRDPEGAGKPKFRTPVKVVEKCNLSEATETKFIVDDRINRIIVNIDGNISKAVLRIPTNNLNSVPITKYHQNIEMRDDIKLSNDRTADDFSKGIIAERQNSNATIDYELDSDRKINRHKSLKDESFVEDLNNETSLENSDDDDSSTSSNIENALATFAIDDGHVTTSNNPRDNKHSSGGIFSTENRQEIRARSSVGSSENVDNKRPIINGVSMSMKIIESLDNRELSEETVNHENTIDEKKMLIELNRNSNLLVTPGTIHRIVFDAMNNCVLPVRYGFRVKSTAFRVYNLQPTYAWIYPGQMSNVAVDLIIPDNAAPDTANTVTLSIQGTEIKDKSVYLYVQGSLSKLTDDVKPKLEYSFNNNCAGKLEKSRCYKSRWSMDITIQDYDSGLKRVIASPNEIYPRTKFISGTRNPVTFYYSATCCDTTAKITAIDLLDNYNTNTIDVTAWNNLSEAEIAAITVGVLLAICLIIFIIILIIYCIRRRKSLDLPYTQRYGSRPPAHAERTSF
ncbi:uncharacterized protein LOC143348182 isoform X2 [Colletes latitarsis]|uniref:uncharacterized protein LOC143348182 isoform X2 n=1 Tax=Colletes latitarsis TaxID=2605962 RepID=UPI0040354602